MTSLQLSWREWYESKLPALSKAKDKAQKKWPVVNDHCFARIILDSVVDNERPWHEVVKRPAWKNLSEKQLKDAIKLAEKIASGDADLVELDESSLFKRGKKSKTTKEKSVKPDIEKDLGAESKAKSELDEESRSKSDSETKDLKMRKRKRRIDNEDTNGKTKTNNKKHHDR